MADGEYRGVPGQTHCVNPGERRGKDSNNILVSHLPILDKYGHCDILCTLKDFPDESK